MNELMWLQMLGGYAGSGIDVAAIIAFVAFAVLYFLAPVVGYQNERPAGMLTAMYLMAAQIGIVVIQVVINWIEVLGGIDRARMTNVRGLAASGEHMVHYTFAFALAKLCLFLVAMFAFINGLRALRRESSRSDTSPYGIGK